MRMRIRCLDVLKRMADKADPERIKSEMGMSKAAFKRAVGRLLKQGKIQIDNEVGKIFAVNKNR
jgi:predicted RNA-binding protein (virulence factor B family)